MKVLVVGSGGREHAICLSVSKSPRVDKIYCAPGNAGIGQLAECVPIGAMEFEKLAKEVEERKKEIRATILHEMEATGTVGIDTEELTITYVAPTTSERFDSKKLKKDNPDLYDEYIKISPVKSSIRISIKEEK